MATSIVPAANLVAGAVYRRRDLHAAFGGQLQGGIATPAGGTVVLLFSGESGQQYGYRDGLREDGTYWYTGEGQVGDMQMAGGNRAILRHQEHGKTLLLFEHAQKGHVRFLGTATYAGHHTEVAPDRDGRPRQAIVFELALESDPAGAVPALDAPLPREPSALWTLGMADLRARALTASRADAPPTERKANAHARSEAVRVYVLRRAQGVCEGCAAPAPFLRPDGRPYLEPHHIRRRADAGPDHPRWVIALCPNCHRRVHSGRDGATFNSELADRAGLLEAQAVDVT